jgi:hypothetical protein
MDYLVKLGPKDMVTLRIVLKYLTLGFQFLKIKLWGKLIGDHPQADLAKFGYKSSIIIFWISLYFGDMLEFIV